MEFTGLYSENPDAMKMSDGSPVAAFEMTQRPEQSIYGVISNTTPLPLPPMAVVPKRWPALSLTRP